MTSKADDYVVMYTRKDGSFTDDQSGRGVNGAALFELAANESKSAAKTVGSHGLKAVNAFLKVYGEDVKATAETFKGKILRIVRKSDNASIEVRFGDLYAYVQACKAYADKVQAAIDAIEAPEPLEVKREGGTTGEEPEKKSKTKTVKILKVIE